MLRGMARCCRENILLCKNGIGTVNLDKLVEISVQLMLEEHILGKGIAK